MLRRSEKIDRVLRLKFFYRILCVLFVVLQVGMAGNVVYRDRVVWKKSYGLKDKRQQGQPPNQDTVFRVASISKIFTVSQNIQSKDFAI